jgi:hypothetical protein
MPAHREEQEPPRNQPQPRGDGTPPPQPELKHMEQVPDEPGLEAKVEQLLAKHEEILATAEKPKPKDRWDKIGLSGPLAVAAVGVLLTTVYQCNVTRQAKITQEATQRAQNLQSFSAFMPYLTSGDSARQELAITALRRLGNCEVAALAAGLNPSSGTRAGLIELKRIAAVNPDQGCNFADTVYQRIFLNPDSMPQWPADRPLPRELGRAETISRRSIPVDTPRPKQE